MRRPSLYRLAVSLVLLLHLATSLAWIGNDDSRVRKVHLQLLPWEQILGFNQNWGMFAPPPHYDVWPEAYGLDAQGQRRELRMLWSNRDGDGRRPAYNYELLVDRNLLPKGNGALRRSYGEWLCRREAEAGQPIEQLELYEVRQRSRTPRQRSRGEAGKPLERRRMLGMACP